MAHPQLLGNRGRPKKKVAQLQKVGNCGEIMWGYNVAQRSGLPGLMARKEQIQFSGFMSERGRCQASISSAWLMRLRTYLLRSCIKSRIELMFLTTGPDSRFSEKTCAGVGVRQATARLLFDFVVIPEDLAKRS